jgi:hypothetical protein
VVLLSTCREILIRWDKKIRNDFGLFKLTCMRLWDHRQQQ